MTQITLTLLFAWISAKVDANLINNGNYIDDHRSRFVIRALVVLLISWFNSILFIGLGLIFTSLFDPLLNYYRGLSFWYLGTVAKWDRFFNKHKTLYKVVRILSLIIGLVILLYKKDYLYSVLN